MFSWVTLIIGAICTITPSYYVSYKMNVSQQKVYDKTINSIVSVISPVGDNFVSLGTGFFVNNETIVTAAHVFPELKNNGTLSTIPWIQFNNDSVACAVELVDFDVENDLAILKLVDEKDQCLNRNNWLSLAGDGSEIHFLKRIYSIGNAKDAINNLKIKVVNGTDGEQVNQLSIDPMTIDRGFASTTVVWNGRPVTWKNLFFNFDVNNNGKWSLLPFQNRPPYKARKFFVWLYLHPGRSGGPIVDGDGRVLGVVHGDLFTKRSSVTTVIHASDVLRLLNKNQIKVDK